MEQDFIPPGSSPEKEQDSNDVVKGIYGDSVDVNMPNIPIPIAPEPKEEKNNQFAILKKYKINYAEIGYVNNLDNQIKIM